MKVKLLLSYDGTDFRGFQYQPQIRTVQGVLEQALGSLTNETIRITGCSRTDSGVHANYQVVTFETCSKIPPDKFYIAIRAFLPPDIDVYSSTEVSEQFHPSRDALAKMYSYSITCEEILDIRKKRYVYRIDKLPDLARMQEACQLIIGRKDFKSFCASGSQVKTTTRTIYDCRIEEVTNRNYVLRIVGDGFLYKMVRIIVGLILEIGIGNLTTQNLEKIISMKDRTKAPYTAPPWGLCLEKVWYSKENLENCLTKELV